MSSDLSVFWASPRSLSVCLSGEVSSLAPDGSRKPRTSPNTACCFVESHCKNLAAPGQNNMTPWRHKESSEVTQSLFESPWDNNCRICGPAPAPHLPSTALPSEGPLEAVVGPTSGPTEVKPFLLSAIAPHTIRGTDLSFTRHAPCYPRPVQRGP